MVPVAELRVYQPLEAFPPEEQAHWERFIVRGALRPSRPRYADLATPSRLGFLLEGGDEGARVKVVEGVYHVCPDRTRMRVLAALLSFHEAAPFEGSEAFMPDRAVRRARRELHRMRRRDPGRIATIMQSPWHVPVRWFVLFDDEERRLREVRGRHRLSYLTTTRRAIRRIEHAVPILRNTDLGPVAEPIVELHSWLSAFDPSSLLELDYDRLSDLMTWDELDDDRSARDVAEALKALAAREFPRSADLYQAALTRSAELHARESSN